MTENPRLIWKEVKEVETNGPLETVTHLIRLITADLLQDAPQEVSESIVKHTAQIELLLGPVTMAEIAFLKGWLDGKLARGQHFSDGDLAFIERLNRAGADANEAFYKSIDANLAMSQAKEAMSPIKSEG